MKKYLLPFILILLISNCSNEEKADIKFVQNRFHENVDTIFAIQFNVQRIDTFLNGNVWNNTGEAIVEKDKTDDAYGMSFFGIRDDVQLGYIYDSGNGFEVNHENKTYKLEYPGGILGSPGGQMIPQNIFKLDSEYKSVTLTEGINSYNLTYEFEDDTTRSQSNIVKTLRLNKTDFLPQKIEFSFLRYGNKSTTEFMLSDLKINEEVTKTVEELKNQFKDYELIQSEEKKVNEILSQQLPPLKLPTLFDNKKIVSIESSNILLIDFWEAWCSPCIEAFPKIEELKNKFSDNLSVIGIVSDNLDIATKLAKEKGGAYQHFIGNEKLEDTFRVYSWPRYFLVDKRGIIRKEYIGYSEQIENDIIALLSE